MAATGKRRKREQAVQALYGQSFARARNAAELETAFCQSASAADESRAAEGFAWDLTSGVWQNEQALDHEIEKFAHHWRIEKIGRIELILIRLALFEMLHMKTPPRVAIEEYLQLAGEFGADSAKSFINGVLNAAARANPVTAAQIKSQKGKE